MIAPDTIHCLDFEELCQNVGEQSVDLIATDMPYGTTACSWDVRVDFDTWWDCVKRVLKPRGVFLTTASEPFASLLRVSNLEWYKYDWVWDKVKPSGMQTAIYKPMPRHELVLTFSLNSAKYYPIMNKRRKIKVSKAYSFSESQPVGQIDNRLRYYDEYYPQSIIKYSNANQVGKLHPTQKPVALYEYLIKTYTQPGDIVLDPFCGSGTTGLACIKTNRRYILGDSSPEYVETARERLRNSDPYQPTVKDGVEQLSLFTGLGGS